MTPPPRGRTPRAAPSSTLDPRGAARFLAAALLAAGCLGGCRAGLPPSPGAEPAARRPEIRRMIDLGALPPREGESDPGGGDGRFTAGEWVQLEGPGLSDPAARVFLDDRPVHLAEGEASGVLRFRLPGDLAFRHTYRLAVETPGGRAEAPLSATHLVAMRDARGNRLALWRTSADPSAVLEEEALSVPVPRCGPFAFSPAGGFLVAVSGRGRSQGGGETQYELRVVHTGARGGPREVAAVPMRCRREPSSVAVSPSGEQAYVLTGAELLVFDLRDPRRPRPTAIHTLPGASPETPVDYGRLLLFAGGTRAAALDRAGNRVAILDLSQPAAPAWVGTFPAGPPSRRSYVVDLAADRGNPRAFWLLTGVNGLQLRQRFLRFWERGDTPGAALVSLELSGSELRPGRRVALPDASLPLSLLPEPGGDVLVAAVELEAAWLRDASLSVDGLFDLLRGLKSPVLLGRILRVRPGGEVETEVRSPDVFLSLAQAPGGPPLVSSYRVRTGVSLSPTLDVQLTVQVLGAQRVAVRELGWETAVPPYDFFPEVAVQ